MPPVTTQRCRQGCATTVASRRSVLWYRGVCHVHLEFVFEWMNGPGVDGGNGRPWGGWRARAWAEQETETMAWPRTVPAEAEARGATGDY